jgi:hypothetical protein
MGQEGGVDTQRQLFGELLALNKPDLLRTLQESDGVSVVYQIASPVAGQEPFFVVGYTAKIPAAKRRPEVTNMGLVAITADDEIVGFGSNYVTTRPQALQSTGTIATEESGKYYGYGIEVAKQHMLQALANQRRIRIVHTVKKYSEQAAQRPVWRHFFANDKGPFRYGAKGTKVYRPTSANSGSHFSGESPQEFSVQIVKENDQSHWRVSKQRNIAGSNQHLDLLSKRSLTQKLKSLRP